MLDLFGDEIKVKKPRKRPSRLNALVAYTGVGKRYPAWVFGSRIESLAGPVAKSAMVWLVVDSREPVRARRLIAAYHRLKKAGYQYLLYALPAK